MSFENEYCREMDSIRHKEQLDEKILAKMEQKGYRKTYGAVRWKAVVAMLAIVCMAAFGVNIDKVTAYGESLYGSFKFLVGGQEILLDEIEPLAFDYEAFCKDAKVDKYQFGDVCVNQEGRDSVAYENEDKMYESIGLRLPGDEKLDYKIIRLQLVGNNVRGNITTTLVWNGIEYGLNGMFLTEFYEEGKIGYGELNGFATAYEYADGKWAYFTTGNGYEAGTVQRVYFTMDGFIFQMFVEDSKEGVKTAKEILKVMAE